VIISIIPHRAENAKRGLVWGRKYKKRLINRLLTIYKILIYKETVPKNTGLYKKMSDKHIVQYLCN